MKQAPHKALPWGWCHRCFSWRRLYRHVRHVRGVDGDCNVCGLRVMEPGRAKWRNPEPAPVKPVRVPEVTWLGQPCGKCGMSGTWQYPEGKWCVNCGHMAYT